MIKYGKRLKVKVEFFVLILSFKHKETLFWYILVHEMIKVSKFLSPLSKYKLCLLEILKNIVDALFARNFILIKIPVCPVSLCCGQIVVEDHKNICSNNVA